jgi:polyferredoxin/thioredoxin-like negative regulator of GroEL
MSARHPRTSPRFAGPPAPRSESARGAARTVHLPVLVPGEQRTSCAVRRPSNIGRWRAGALIAVHLLMVGHILHWWLTGRSFGRFVLSDSMRTLEIGEVNPGAILFAASLFVTALFGRLMCGWACHMGALQDLCAWLLRRIGVRPRLFRSRLLGYVPLGLAFYMFLWPTIRREVVQPVRLPPGDAPPFPGFSAELLTDDLWRDMPSWQVAVPFLLVCGFATVYFLGARGLCRYACPYGGFLLPTEQLAVGRVVVDMSRCDQCGICTAACTAGVRVHDEVRLYGSVTDRNCVRSFDCVGACPQGALRFSIARPAILRRGRAPRPAPVRPDLPLVDELACLTVFLASFFVLRGLYELVPLLMAATLAVLSAFLAWKMLRLLRDPNVRLGRMQLRLQGRLRPAGWGFLCVFVLLSGLLLHSAAVRAIVWQASRHDDRVGVPYEIALSGRGVLESDRAEAAEAKRLYALARPIWHGGLALASTPSAEFRLAWVSLVTGDKAGASAVLRDMTRSGRAGPNASTELARLMLSDGKQKEAIALLDSVVARHPRWAGPRDMLALLWAGDGGVSRAESMYRRVLDRRPSDAAARIGLGRLMMLAGRPGEGIEQLRLAAGQWPRNADARRELATALFATGKAEEAAAELRAAAGAIPARRAEFLGYAEHVLRAPGR